MLAQDGWSVFGVRRDPSHLPTSIHPIAADLSDPNVRLAVPVEKGEAPGPLDAVVYCVGSDSRAVEDYQLAYMDGPARVIAALGGAEGLKHTAMIFVSSTAVYAETGGGWVDESSALLPRSDPHAHALLSGEEAFLAAAPRAHVLRLSGIYGPGRTSLLDRVRKDEQTANPKPGPDRYTNRVHRDDAAGMIRWMLTDHPEPGIFNGSDGEAPPLSTVAAGLRTLLGTAGSPSPAPDYAVGKRVANAKALAAGYRFTYPDFRSGYAALIRAAADTTA